MTLVLARSARCEGFEFTVASSPLTATALGRWVYSGNNGLHTVALYDASGNALSGGSVSVNTSGQPAGQFVYANLGTGITLAANTTYAVMSDESSGGDEWYDYSGTDITLASVASGAFAYWANNNPPPLNGAVSGQGQSYGPVSLEYSTGGGGGSWVLASETHYLYDGRRVIQERDGNNNPLVSYTRGNDLSGSLEGAGGIGGLLARSSGYSGGSWTVHDYYHADGNGNITYLEDGNQNLAASYVYDPYGNVLSSSGTLASANTYRFSSKEVHASSGLYYYDYRFYDPPTARWVNRDPIQEWGGINLFTFSDNDPVDDMDPFGLQEGSGPAAPGFPPWSIPCELHRLTSTNYHGGIYTLYPISDSFALESIVAPKSTIDPQQRLPVGGLITVGAKFHFRWMK